VDDIKAIAPSGSIQPSHRVARELSSKSLSEIDAMPKQLGALNTAGISKERDEFLLKPNGPILRD
jgi:hypothetical protein